MPAFLKKNWVKVLGAIFCVLFLAAAAFSGLLALYSSLNGGFTGQSELFQNMIQSRFFRDSQLILEGYFDPSDPTHPWVSYFSGPIYTGRNSNMLWEITNDNTGEVVLSTYDGQDSFLEYSDATTFTTQESTPRDRYVMDSQIFYCDGTLYSYNEDADRFTAVKTSSTQVISGIDKLDTLARELGFTFNGSHYEYNSDNDEFDWADDTTEIYTDVDTPYVIHCYLLTGLPYSDQYQQIYQLCAQLYESRQPLCVMAIVCLVLGLMLLVSLCCTVGRVNGKEEPVLNPIHKLPGDLVLLVVALWIAFGISLTQFDFSYFTASLISLGIISGLLSLGVTYLLPSLCVRIKTHTLLKNTICYRLSTWIKRIAGSLGQAVSAVFLHLPLFWKVMAAYLALCVLELIGLNLFFYGSGALYFFWIIEKLLVGGIIAYVCMSFLRLKSGAERISAGDYNTKVSTNHLVLEFKSTAETLNHIQDGISTAVDRRMRSERLKTELITNVSHDLKTPLTSIVSYVDLLKQEPAGSPAAQEYLQVLDRQSARLKKLIEDLVEASKASTGNITVHAVPLDFSMMLGQALGEYSERLEKAGLTPVPKIPEGPVMISADGRLLWRILDNLLGNAVKYAMPGTRLYVTLTADTHAIVTFRNISRDPLDVTPEELMERFVRGDSSRHTEGSGLGLSIARSLAESMGGEFILSVDGDLFKAAVIFPVLPQTPSSPEDTPSEPPEAPGFS